MTQPNEEPVPVRKLYITTLNMSSVFLQSYPETSPWDMDTVGVTDLHPPPEVLRPTICPLDARVKALALAQAQRTGVNPFYFMCSSNPFFLDNWDLEKAVLPLKGYQVPRALPFLETSPGLISDLEEIHMGDGQCMLRVKLDGEPRVLKLFMEAEDTGSAGDSPSGFRRELDAYTLLVHYGVCESGAVPKCYGWLRLNLDVVQSFAPRLGSPLSPVVTFLVDTMLSVAGHCWRGLILEDLSGFVPLSIHNISGTVASSALKALCQVHSAFVQHGNLARQHVMLLPQTGRVIWIGFSGASCGEGSVSRQSLFHELAQTWSLLYQKLLPDAFIGFDDDSVTGAALWKRKMVANPSHCSSGVGSLQRVPQRTVEAEIEAIISAYPEKNLLDWNPPIHNIIPEPKDDHKYDSAELLSAAQEWQARWTDDNLFFKWHGRCPILLQDHQRFAQSGTTFEDYHAPPPLPQIPMDPGMEILECLRQTGPHPLLRVRLRGEERLLKVDLQYSGGWWDPDIASYESYLSSLAYRTSQQRFEIEKSAYAHLVHYGVCDAGAVPVCYGWMEMSEGHIAQANTLIAATMKDFSFTGWRYRPPFIDPIFVDGSPAAALVLEYIPDAEVLQARNITYELAASAMRAFTRIHGAYVLHGDVPSESKNILVAKGNPSRVVVVDFDHALDLSLSRERLVRGDFRKELQDIWIMLYSYMLPDQRTECALPHPHDV
ncbi:hypothetical protein VTO73DRAFT_10113 [Trametes versicolor]